MAPLAPAGLQATLAAQESPATSAIVARALDAESAGRNREAIGAWRAAIAAWLSARLDARLHPAKTVLQPVRRGITFVGHVIKPWRRTTRSRTVRSALRELSTMPSTDLFASGNSYFGLLRQASHSHHDRTRVAKLMLQRGHVVQGDMTKIYRRTT